MQLCKNNNRYNDAGKICKDICHGYLLFCRLPKNRQNTIAAAVLTKVARIAGAITAAGLALPYWVRYTIIFTGMSCRDEVFKIRNVHISRLATRSPLHPVSSPEAMLLSPAYPALLLRFPKPGVPRSSSSFASASMAFRPAGVHAQPSPNILAMKLVAIYCLASCFSEYPEKKG